MLTDRNAISISGISTSSPELGAGVVNVLCSKSPRDVSTGCEWYLIPIPLVAAAPV